MIRKTTKLVYQNELSKCDIVILGFSVVGSMVEQCLKRRKALKTKNPNILVGQYTLFNKPMMIQLPLLLKMLPMFFIDRIGGCTIRPEKRCNGPPPIPLGGELYRKYIP